MKAAPLPEQMPDGPFLRTLLQFLARADAPMSADGWWLEPLTLDDINAAVTAYNLARIPINDKIASADDETPSSIDGHSVALFDGRIEFSVDSIVRLLLTPGRKATLYLDELSTDEVAGGFRLYSNEGLLLNIDKADAAVAKAA